MVKLLKKDSNLLILLLIISFVSVYYLPMTVNQIIFLVILASTYFTKLDYVYLVWFFIINDAPGRLFSGGRIGDIRLPLYSIVPGFSFSVQDIFILIYIIKFINLKKTFSFIFKKEIYRYYLFGAIVLLYSFILGMNMENLIQTGRFLLSLTLIIIIPACINNEKKLLRTSLLLFPIILVALVSQFYTYATGSSWEILLRGIEISALEITEESPSRSSSSVYIIFFSLIMAIFYYFNKRKTINKIYLVLIILSAYLSIFLSASRGWILAFSFIIAGIPFLLFGSSGFLLKALRFLGVTVIVLIIIQYQSPVLQRQIWGSYYRLLTVESLLEGDITAQGTLSRLSERGPNVINKFSESPLIGFGFSTEYYKYADAHVGNQNILLNTGIAGFIFLLYLFIYLVYKTWVFSRDKWIIANYGKSLRVFILAFAAIFIIHSSSTQFWGYALHFNQIPKSILWGLLLASVNVFIIESGQKQILREYESAPN